MGSLRKGLKEPLPCHISHMLSKTLKNSAEHLLKPVAKIMGKLGIKPNHITVMGLILTFWAAWFLYNKEIYLAFFKSKGEVPAIHQRGEVRDSASRRGLSSFSFTKIF